MVMVLDTSVDVSSGTGVLVAVGVVVGEDEGVGLNICLDPQAGINKPDNRKSKTIVTSCFPNLSSDTKCIANKLLKCTPPNSMTQRASARVNVYLNNTLYFWKARCVPAAARPLSPVCPPLFAGEPALAGGTFG
jgi:hypothetical protein